ncbi:MAG: flagellar filament capping protein FliD [Terracidiphilus sp.]
MGTVGLDFGSPTSGAGFNVSSTVAEIVGNLQKVETPWQTQLTSLESQDTAISSLGSLLSNVSTDISQLTDLQGILAQKEGSSSDTNVLELTAATSSATAGTHTVVVNSLAQTSSGYLAEIAKSSDTLSGSVTLKVGSGTAHTITLSSSDNTLTGLASAINSSGVGITASVLTDATGSRLSLVSGTSGANGNIAVTNNSLSAAASNTLGATVTAGTGTGSGSTTSTALLAAVASSSEPLTGTLNVTVNGSMQSIPMSEVGGNTLTALQQYIHTNSTSLGFDASIVNNSDGTASLQLTSGTSGSAGTLAVSSSLVDGSTALAYASTVTGSNASLTVDGINLTSASNTVSNLIPGVTFQLLAPSSQETGGSLEQVQVIIGNDNSSVESAVNQFVSDYNSLVSAVNTQESNTSSGTPEPLFGSPTLSILQQDLLTGINSVNPNGSLDAVSAVAGVTLSGSMTIQAGNGNAETIQIGAVPGDGPASDTIYTGSASGYNTLSGLVNAINSANTSTPVSYSAAPGGDSGTMTATNSAYLSGTLTVQAGDGTAETIYLGPSSDAPAGDLATGTSQNTISSLESFIDGNSTLSGLGITAAIADNGNGTSTMTLTSSNGALTATSEVEIPGLGVTAGIATSSGMSTLTLTSQTAGSSGAIAVTSAIEATTPTAITYTDSGYTPMTSDSGILGEAGTNDTLTGSVTVQVGSGTAQTIDMSTVASAEGGATLGDLEAYINDPGNSFGFTASPVNNSNGSESLQLASNTVGFKGALTVTSNLYDPTNATTSTLGYTNSSDINNLTMLGISVNNDGSLTFDANALDSVLNTDYSSVAGFFQNACGWGQNFSTMLNNAGSSSSSGMLSLAANANSTIESTLNANITKEQSYISAQQSSLTTELNQANEVLQQLPTELQGINELYSAITGYNQGLND